jgi:hypothetical protein
LEAHLQRRLFYNNELPVIFFIGSCAEYHWPEIHRVLLNALEHAGNVAQANAIRPLAEGRAATNKGLVHTTLNENLVIQNEVFLLRTNAWFKIVMGEGLGFEEHWRRYEFAKSRGAIHFHALAWSQERADRIGHLLDEALRLNNASMDEFSSMRDYLSREHTAAQSIQAEIPALFGTPFTAEHPAGNNTLG